MADDSGDGELQLKEVSKKNKNRRKLADDPCDGQSLSDWIGWLWPIVKNIKRANNLAAIFSSS